MTPTFTMIPDKNECYVCSKPASQGRPSRLRPNEYYMRQCDEHMTSDPLSDSLPCRCMFCGANDVCIYDDPKQSGDKVALCDLCHIEWSEHLEREQRTKEGRCIQCGVDLSSTTPSRWCPRCLAQRRQAVESRAMEAIGDAFHDDDVHWGVAVIYSNIDMRPIDPSLLVHKVNPHYDHNGRIIGYSAPVCGADRGLMADDDFFNAGNHFEGLDLRCESCLERCHDGIENEGV